MIGDGVANHLEPVLEDRWVDVQLILKCLQPSLMYQSCVKCQQWWFIFGRGDGMGRKSNERKGTVLENCQRPAVWVVPATSRASTQSFVFVWSALFGFRPVVNLQQQGRSPPNGGLWVFFFRIEFRRHTNRKLDFYPLSQVYGKKKSIYIL